MVLVDKALWTQRLMQTSILMALLGEMYYKPHGLGSWYSLPRDGGIAYAPQESWVLNDTIRVRVSSSLKE